jgi:hypothetical protein
MKKISVYALLLAIVMLNCLFASCEQDEEKRNKLKKHKLYFTKYNIYNSVDSTASDISVYVGVVDGHKYRYHLYTAKNKSQMEVEHAVNECKACKKN